MHEFGFDPITRKLQKKSTLRKLTADVPEDPTVKAEVDKWVKIAYDGFRKDGKISYVQRVPGGKVFLSKEELRQFRAMYTRPVPRASTAFAPAFRGEVPERGCR